MASRIRRALTSIKHIRTASKTIKYSPFDFPFEIIAQILIFAAQVNIDETTQRPKFVVSPLVLCQVSKAWRSYISSRPIFWSQIVISLFQAFRWQHIYIRELYDWLDRAQDIDLDVYIDGYHPPGITLSDPSTNNDVRDFLIANSTRWKTIDASYVENNIISILPSFYSSTGNQSKHFAPLHTLIIRTSHPSRSTPIPTNFSCSPALKNLQVIGFIYPFSCLNPVQTYQISNAQARDIITSITLSYNSYDSPCSLLKAFPCLVEADFHYEMDYLSCFCPAFSRLHHSHIRSLKIRTKFSGNHMNIPSHLEAPNLEVLHISIERRRSQDCDISNITRLVRQSSCRLVRLTLQLALPEECHIILLLGFLPNLVELHLRDVEPSAEYSSTLGLSRAFFDALHPHSRNLILPTLRFLSLEGTLAIDSLDALEGLVLRLRQSWTTEIGTGSGSSSNASVVKLQFAKIQTDQKGLRLEEKDSLFVADLTSFVEKNSLWLLNSDGSMWI